MERRTALPHGGRFTYVDLLKAFASQLIVLHHLAFYGPMADFARPLAPGVIDWFADVARIVVQIFLVVGGFLAAKALCPAGKPRAIRLGEIIWRRWTKLVPPYLAALLFAMLASYLAARLMTHFSISSPPTPKQLLAHVLLLQDVLQYEALSAGIWYVAIDFQLYAGLALLAWWCHRRNGGRGANGWLFPFAVGAIGIWSLMAFNRNPELDMWGVYFFGSYAFGCFAWWAGDPERPRGSAIALTGMLVVGASWALHMEFRSRIAFAFATALFLIAARSEIVRLPRLPAAVYLGKISYALLLTHFPVSLLVNAVFFRFLSHDAPVQGAGMLAAWLTSIAAAAAFHRWVELPLGRLFEQPRLSGNLRVAK